MFKAPTGVQLLNCHHFRRIKSLILHTYTDPCGMCKTTSDKHPAHTQEAASTAIFIQCPVRESETTPYNIVPQVLVHRALTQGTGVLNSGSSSVRGHS